MQRDEAQLSKRLIEPFGSALSRGAVRNAMETVTPVSALGIRLRDGVTASARGHRCMERCVEYGHVAGHRQQLARDFESIRRDSIVQGCQSPEIADGRDYVVVDAHGLAIEVAAVDDAVTDAGEVVERAMRLFELADHGLQRSAMIRQHGETAGRATPRRLVVDPALCFTYAIDVATPEALKGVGIEKAVFHRGTADINAQDPHGAPLGRRFRAASP